MEEFESEDIIKAIEHRADNMDEWCIGVTADPHNNPNAHHGAWRFWHAHTEDGARIIKEHFVGKGMAADPDEKDEKEPTYVYIY